MFKRGNEGSVLKILMVGRNIGLNFFKWKENEIVNILFIKYEWLKLFVWKGRC